MVAAGRLKIWTVKFNHSECWAKIINGYKLRVMSWLVLTFTIKWSRIQGPGTRITDNKSYYSVSAVYLLYSCLCFKIIILKYKKIAHPEVTNLKSLMTISVRMDEHSSILYWSYINIVLVTVILHVGETYHNQMLC